jgi:Xaa-Pro aminopeptidase
MSWWTRPIHPSGSRASAANPHPELVPAGAPSGTSPRIAHVTSTITTDQWIQISIAGITALAALIALVNVAITIVNERRRSQPILVAHEARSRQFASSATTAAWVVDAYLSSEGGGPAFNVRFGVEFNGVRYPYRLRMEDPDSGNVQRVMKPGDRRPEADSWPVLIDSLSMWGRAADSKGSGDLDANRMYWARYENAQGKTWETRNPGDRSARLDIRRVRWVRLHEWRERRTLKKAGQHDKEWLRKALAELRAGMDEAADE